MEWQPIETAPKDGTEVDLWVIFDGEGSRVADAKFGLETHNGFGDPISKSAQWVVLDCDVTGEWHWDSVGGEITHWMPLPDAPDAS